MQKVKTSRTVLVFAGVLLLFQAVSVNLALATENRQYPEAQEIIEKIVVQYPELVRLTIHAVPAGQKSSRIIACNLKEKIGKPSDPEDLEAMKTKKATVLQEGGNLDITAPVLDISGNAIAATGITLPLQKDAAREHIVKKAELIAAQLTAEIQNAQKTLW